MTITFSVPIKLPNRGNATWSGWKRMRIVKGQRKAVGYCLLSKTRQSERTVPATVTLTRVAPRQLDGHDNLRMSFKAVVDQIAECYGVDDGDPRWTWQYDQRRGGPKEYAVEVTIRAGGG